MPGVVGVLTGIEHAAQRGGQQVAVATGIEKPLARAGHRFPRRRIGRHVLAATGIQHGHHRGLERGVLVVFLPVQAAGPMQQIGHAHAGMGVHGRVEAGDRVLQLEAAFALGYAQ
ncbi:hypothetical protein D3C75_1054770 [compost metagenome]